MCSSAKCFQQRNKCVTLHLFYVNLHLKTRLSERDYFQSVPVIHQGLARGLQEVQGLTGLYPSHGIFVETRYIY